ncbi:MerR family DNA-binding transcriptional regulator [Nocardioides anomalus]|uniref:MerR family DNA-binding transcriptional regulator n=1 Tax=Nocardioides anomalus TaxID=2712223 RepID=A0A6G6W7Z3_9ACTN|nr:DICT sensory domain-containing protein [Nocardioides anomalus]QIG41461.1 MerR family DNA-binding transcriptional regulator [Nocardioides anomalus]
MNQALKSALTIGELAAATGVSAPTLRMWESRHGFPTAQRLPSGHRRYAAEQVALVLDVVRRRDAGVRLDAAIAQATREGATAAPQSVYAEIARRHPEQPRQRLSKHTLVALSWAIEDEIGASAARGRLYGAFQTGRTWAPARARWSELARTASATYVFADFADGPATGEEDRVGLVDLAADAPMRREWSVVHDSPELAVALTAWELPGQQDTPDRRRVFESVWTLDPAAVRTAADCCAKIAAESGHPEATAGVAPPVAAATDPAAVSRVAHRALAYADGSLDRTGTP